LDEDDVISAIDAQFTQYELEKLSYPAITDCDRLDTAFATVFTLSWSGSSIVSWSNQQLVDKGTEAVILEN
jgi:hypothetical protein